MVKPSGVQKFKRTAVAATLTTPGKIMRFSRVAKARGHVDAMGNPQTSKAVLELAEERLLQIETNGDPAALAPATPSGPGA